MQSNFQPPWPEWNDNFVNETKWTSQREPFSDPISHGELPSNIPVAKWRRPFDFYEDSNAPWKIVDEHETFDLISNNGHLLPYKVMQWIISSIMCLEKVGQRNSVVTDHYNPNSLGTPEWKPWHHIYSITKVIKGQPSDPKYNPQGMYYIRLFFMGKWRRITVDDHFPYDNEGKLLLPSTSNKCNLWLQILSKALLRVASLSWTDEEDILDFSVITCLTGWTQYKLDCRGVSIDNMWKAIKANLIEKSKKGTKNNFCLTSDSTTCITNRNNYDCDDTLARVVFGVLAETTDEIKAISPAVEHLIYLCSAFKQPIIEMEEMPKWKKLRWVNWALENKVINANPGSYLRIINIFSPFSEVVASHFLKEPEKATKEHFLKEDSYNSLGNFFELIKKEQTKIKVEEKKEEVFEDTMQFNFAEIYPYLRQLEIYYKPQDFHKSLSTNEIEELIDKSSNEQDHDIEDSKKSSKKNKSANMKLPVSHGRLSKLNRSKLLSHKGEGGDAIDNHYKMEPYRFFYLFSDTFYCKNIYITISVVKDNDIKYGYLICQKYSWKSVVLEPLLAGVRTVGTKTCLLQLGPGVQVCRVFYCLPADYNITFNSETYFSVINENKLHELLSQYSKSFDLYGDKLLRAFGMLLPTIPESTEHIQLSLLYKQAFYPPGYKELSTALKLQIARDYDEVFEETFTKYIFELTLPISLKVALVSDLKVIFDDEEFGEQFIQSLDERTKKDIELIKNDVALASVNGSMLFKVKTLNEFYKQEKIIPLQLPGGSKLMIPSTNKSLNDLDQNFFLKPEIHIELLRRILNRKPQYLQLYPFMSDHDLLLKYHEFEGITEVTPIHKLIVIARLTLNIHSNKAVPCSIVAETEFPKAVLYLVDTEKCERLSAPYCLTATYHLKRNKIGYTLLLCGHASKDMLEEPLKIAWRIRVLGQDIGNILHFCGSINPYYCEGSTDESSNLSVDTVTGFYLPNTERVIGRFIIGIKKSIIATIYLSVSNEDIEIGLTIEGGNEEVIATSEGKGCIFLPVLLLDQQSGECFEQDPDVFLFFGTIHLRDKWILSNTELIFAKAIRSSSKKDITSFENLCSEGMESVSFFEDDEDEDEEEDSSPSEMSERGSESSDKISVVSESSSRGPSGSQLSVESGSISHCAYDSSHTESSCSTDGKNSTSISHESDNLNTVSGGSDRTNSPNVSGDSATVINASNEEIKERRGINNTGINSGNSESSITEESCDQWRIEESPYGIFGVAPHWKLSLIVDSKNEEHSFIGNDFIRYEAFQNIKEQWKSEDPKRLKKGERLRKDFLEVNRTDFLNLQLDPDNISISDGSLEEDVLDSNEESVSEEYDIHTTKHVKIMSNNEQKLAMLSLSSRLGENKLEALQNNHPISAWSSDSKNNTAPFSKSSVLPKMRLPGLNNDGLDSGLMTKVSSSIEEEEILIKKQTAKAVSVEKILENTTKKLKTIIHPEQTSSSVSTFEDNQYSEEYEELRCPPAAVMTETLIKEYSLSFREKPTLKHLLLMEDNSESLSEEELKNICRKKKVSLPTVYKKLVAPILWSISKSRAPYCLNDLPIQAYSQNRYCRKLEETLAYHKNETNLQMQIVKNQVSSADYRNPTFIATRLLNY